MWMAKRSLVPPDGTAAEVGTVTVGGTPAAVALGSERRAVAVYAPGGYHWTPARGDEVLVLKSGAEGAPCVVGRAEDDPPQAGAVRLSVCEGTSLVLWPDGGIVLTGEVTVTGRLTVNGTVIGGEGADG